ncbi:MAG: uncharacterized SAM-binding protein YcdF (DUF218 family) [Alphaproteobacteria bacterium]
MPMFILSKIFLFVINPGVWVACVLFIGTVLLWTRRKSLGRSIVTAMTVFLTLIAVLPVGQIMLGPLENRFPATDKVDGQVHGIIVLGGTISQHLTADRGQPALTDGAERLTEFVKLARDYPAAKLIFTGGSGKIFGQALKETDTARLFFKNMALDIERVTFESESRNTLENARFSYRLMKPSPRERWILITSASHMPRAMGVFRKAGWKPLAYPVDFHTLKDYAWGPGFDLVGGLSALSHGLYEWFGLVSYRLLGRTNDIFPAPHPAVPHPSAP